MSIKRKEVRYEFFKYQTGPTGLSTVTLVLDNPASIRFIATGGGTPFDKVTINNAFNLVPIGYTFVGNPNYPYELILDNNSNEVDKTIYTIRIESPANTIDLNVIVKYLVN